MAVTSFKRSLLANAPAKYDSFLTANDYFIPPAYEQIATYTASGSPTTFTFSSIPQTYSSLQIRCNSVTSTTGQLSIRINGDTGFNYAEHYIVGNGSLASTAGDASGGFSRLRYCIESGSTYPGAAIIDIDNYTSTTSNKTVRSFTGTDASAAGFVRLTSGLWLSTNAITSITIFNLTMTTGATFALYGIKGA